MQQIKSAQLAFSAHDNIYIVLLTYLGTLLRQRPAYIGMSSVYECAANSHKATALNSSAVYSTERIGLKQTPEGRQIAAEAYLTGAFGRNPAAHDRANEVILSNADPQIPNFCTADFNFPRSRMSHLNQV